MLLLWCKTSTDTHWRRDWDWRLVVRRMVSCLCVFLCQILCLLMEVIYFTRQYCFTRGGMNLCALLVSLLRQCLYVCWFVIWSSCSQVYYLNSVKVYFDTSFFLIFKIFPVLTGCCDRVKNSRSSVLCGRVVQLELFSNLWFYFTSYISNESSPPG